MLACSKFENGVPSNGRNSAAGNPVLVPEFVVEGIR
jgi:hypothetical protein